MWAVSDVRWAARSDSELPLHRGNGTWAQAYAAGRVPLDSEPAGAHTAAVLGLEGNALIPQLRRLLDETEHRLVASTLVGGPDRHAVEEIRKLESFLGTELPPLPADAPVPADSPHGRTLGLTIDARDESRSIAVLIPHWESWDFLELCVEAVIEHAHPALRQRVYVLDDASRDGSFEAAQARFGDHPDVVVKRIERPNRGVADVGMLLDIGLRDVQEQYVATIDADLYPMSREWLALPVWLVERYGCSAVGLDTGLSTSYTERTERDGWWQPPGGYLPAAGLYDNAWFVCVNNLYRVMPTALAHAASEQAGFARSIPSSSRTRRVIGRILRERVRGIAGEADNGVAANLFLDANRLGPKFNIPITSFIGLTPRDGVFGQNISGLAFHFALSTRALSRERREVGDAGGEFSRWVDRFREAGGINRQLLDELIAASGELKAGGYDGSVPVEWYERQLAFIDGLLEEFRAAPISRS